MAQFALRWILGFDKVSTVIPGAKTRAGAGERVCCRLGPADGGDARAIAGRTGSDRAARDQRGQLLRMELAQGFRIGPAWTRTRDRRIMSPLL